MPLIVHYRWEGKSKKALCGAHRHGHRPRLWGRDWCLVPPPLPKERILELVDQGHLAIPCPLCLAKIAEARSSADKKAEERPPRGFRYWEERPGDGGDDRRSEDGWHGRGHAHEEDAADAAAGD